MIFTTYSSVLFTKVLKHSKTWKIFTLEKKLDSQGCQKFKRQNFSVLALNTETLQAIYQQKFKNTQKHGKNPI